MYSYPFFLLALLAVLGTANAGECQPSDTLEGAKAHIEPLATQARLSGQGDGKLTWTVIDDLPQRPQRADSLLFERWVMRYTDQPDSAQARAWKALADELRCQFSALAVRMDEVPCHNCHHFQVLVWGCTAWGCGGLTGEIFWDS